MENFARLVSKTSHFKCFFDKPSIPTTLHTILINLNRTFARFNSLIKQLLLNSVQLCMIPVHDILLIQTQINQLCFPQTLNWLMNFQNLLSIKLWLLSQINNSIFVVKDALTQFALVSVWCFYTLICLLLHILYQYLHFSKFPPHLLHLSFVTVK